MKRKFQILIEMELQDLSTEERKESAEQYGCKPSDLIGVAEAEPGDIAESVVCALEHPDNEIWAGSELYIKTSKITVSHAKWL